MPADITIRQDGTAEAAFAVNPAWHGLGVVLDHAMTSAEALEKAQLDWDVIQRPSAIGTPRTIQTPEGPVETYSWDKTDHVVYNVREDNGFILGTVTPTYQVIQNREAFAFCDALVEEEEVLFESAFSLDGGRKVVMTARLPGVDEVVEGDEQLRYILMSLSHDGSSAIRFGATSVRVVCSNTYAMALAKDKRTVKELAIRHTGKVSDSLEDARKILGLARDSFSRYTEEARMLAERVLTRDQWCEFLDIICPVPSKNDPDWTEGRERNILKTRQNIATRFESGEHQALPGIEGTAWAAFNAVTEYIDHLPRRGANDRRRAEARFNVTQWGPGRDQKERAFEALRRIVTA